MSIEITVNGVARGVIYVDNQAATTAKMYASKNHLEYFQWNYK
jgi:hypothetical protein